MPLRKLALTALMLIAASAVQAQTPYSGSDNAAGPTGSRPNTNAAAALFDSAAGLLNTEHFIDFESVTVGNFSSKLIAPGVTLSGADYAGGQLVINNTPSFPSSPELSGYNTTSGGSHYFDMQGGTATFTFSSPIQAFGAYFTGVQPGFFLSTLTFNDGTTQTDNLPSSSSLKGGVGFLGFTDPGKTITQVTITASDNLGNGDFIGIDDVRFVPTGTNTPEPGFLSLLAGIGLSASALVVRRRRPHKG